MDKVNCFLEALKRRRSRYALTNECPISDKALTANKRCVKENRAAGKVRTHAGENRLVCGRVWYGIIF